MRITLDLDRPSELKLLSAYFNLKRFGDVEVRKSAGGAGYHLIVRGVPITYEDSLRIRAMLRECPMRLRFDEEATYKPKQILWKAKVIRGKRYEARQIDERTLLALPWASRVPRSAYRRGTRFERQV